MAVILLIIAFTDRLPYIQSGLLFVHLHCSMSIPQGILQLKRSPSVKCTVLFEPDLLDYQKMLCI